VSYSVHFKIDLAALPAEVRLEVEKTMQQIAEALVTVPPTSPFWSSARDSVLQIDVEGWRMGYRLFPVRREVQVIEASPIRR
jgi:hypothetical protein